MFESVFPFFGKGKYSKKKIIAKTIINCSIGRGYFNFF